MGFGKDGKGVIMHERAVITLGALAGATAIKSDAQLSFDEDFRLIKTEYWVSFEGITVTEIPIVIGIADNELTVAEIAETLGAAPTDRNDWSTVEESLRPVFPMNTVPVSNVASGSVAEGQMLEKTFRWTFSNDEGFTWFAFNDTGAQLTTGGIIRIRAKHYGVWVT